MINDTQLDDLLATFKPSIGEADSFMERLQSRLDIADQARIQSIREVEKVKKRSLSLARASRRAIVAASLVGFVVGVFATFFLRPLWINLTNTWHLSGAVAPLAQAGLWIAVGTVSSVCAVNVYTLARTIALRKD